MKRTISTLALLSALAGGLTVGAVQAQAPEPRPADAPPPVSRQPMSPVPQPPDFFDHGQYGSIPWISGGVGSDERDYLNQHYGSDYNLKLEFAVPQGSYVGDVDVVISRPGGAEVLRVHSSGPWLLTRLPAGGYHVEVSGYGQSFSAQVTIPAGGHKTTVFNQWQGPLEGPRPVAPPPPPLPTPAPGPAS